MTAPDERREADEPDDEREDDQREDDDSDRASELRETLGAEANRLQRGRKVSLLGAELPVRVLIALGIFVLVFMLVWTGLWAALGTLGLALGWIPAALIGVLATRLAGEPSSAT